MLRFVKHLFFSLKEQKGGRVDNFCDCCWNNFNDIGCNWWIDCDNWILFGNLIIVNEWFCNIISFSNLIETFDCHKLCMIIGENITISCSDVDIFEVIVTSTDPHCEPILNETKMKI